MRAQDKSWEILEAKIVKCRQCPRLVIWREKIARQRRRAYRDWDYWGKPVPGFGDRDGSVLVVGLAPGAHGANRTGRMFTGDGSGNFLFRALYEAGFASQPTATHRGDGLELKDIFITAVCRCAPPGNRPTRQEMDNCLPYMMQEMELLEPVRVIVALGQIAFDNVLRTYRQIGHEVPRLDFRHGATYRLGERLPWLVVSYHPSRQNTQTGRLTESMFEDIWNKVRKLILK